jgi:hypothetical protein
MNGKKLVQAVVEVRRDDEKQLLHREFIEIQIRANYVVRIQHRVRSSRENRRACRCDDLLLCPSGMIA